MGYLKWGYGRIAVIGNDKVKGLTKGMSRAEVECKTGSLEQRH